MPFPLTEEQQKIVNDRGGELLVSAAAGPGKLTKLISMLGDAFALVLAMTGAAAVVLLISLLSSMTALTPG